MRRLSEAELLVAGIVELMILLDENGCGEEPIINQLIDIQRNLRVATGTPEEYQEKLAKATRRLDGLRTMAPTGAKNLVNEKISALIIFAFRVEAHLH